jgi:hypothetical protein
MGATEFFRMDAPNKPRKTQIDCRTSRWRGGPCHERRQGKRHPIRQRRRIRMSYRIRRFGRNPGCRLDPLAGRASSFLVCWVQPSILFDALAAQRNHLSMPQWLWIGRRCWLLGTIDDEGKPLGLFKSVREIPPPLRQRRAGPAEWLNF